MRVNREAESGRDTPRDPDPQGASEMDRLVPTVPRWCPGGGYRGPVLSWEKFP